MKQGIAKVTATLLGLTLVVAIAWYGGRRQYDDAPDAGAGIPEHVQHETSQLLTVDTVETTRRVERLRAESGRLHARIAALDPIRAPTALSLQSNEIIDRRELLDPGPSSFEAARREQRTPSGLSPRALDAYTRETGIDPRRIEALMQRAREY